MGKALHGASRLVLAQWAVGVSVPEYEIGCVGAGHCPPDMPCPWHGACGQMQG
jgi:hypothetical protein